MTISRRDLLVTLGSLGLGTFLLEPEALALMTPSRKSGSKLLGGRFNFDPKLKLQKKHLCETHLSKVAYRYDAEKNEMREIATKTAGHVVETHPIDANLAAISARQMDTLSVVDWNLRREIATHKFDESRLFYGHCIFSQNGQHLLATAIHLNDQIGRIYVFDFPSMKVSDVVVLNTGAPHDIVPIGNDRFVIGAGSTPTQPAQFVTFDFKRRHLSYHPTTFGAGSKMDLIHLKATPHHVHGALNLRKDGKLMVGGLAQFTIADGRVSVPMSIENSPAPTEILSIEYDSETNYAWLTLPWENLVLIWDVQNQKLVHSIATPTPVSSISLLPAFDAMVIGSLSGFSVVSRKTFKPIEKHRGKLPSKVIAGYHVAHTRVV